MNLQAECNLKKLQERFKDIEDTLLGLKTPVSTFICDEAGRITDKKIQEFTDKIINHMCFRGGYFVGIDGARKHYYELLFFLIFRAFDPDMTVYDFGDLLHTAEEMKRTYRNREELILHDGEILGKPVGFFEVIRNSCKLLTHKILAEDWTREELQQMEKGFKRKKKMQSRRNADAMQVFQLSYDEKEAMGEKYERYGIEGYYDYEDAVERELWDRYEEQAYLYDEVPEEEALDTDAEMSCIWSKKEKRYLTVEEEKELQIEKQGWINSFINPQSYLDAYREFSELLFCVNASGDALDLEKSVLHILKSKRMNKLEDAEKFASLYAELNRALRIARRRY